MAFPKFAEQLEYIAAVTKALNAMPTPSSDVGFHLHVELRENDTYRKAGEWSDEIAPDSWSYSDDQGF
ncbi:hypothetical protein [Arthrobacter sp. A2-55]|uniref:hypothetical protein n=1 Tax=Arthrobacter sp. A2-55 TaxID=2897337 RepID=UPI0021CD1B72|nr:hypothetical protein [Arthrobacter sp. A2-55]MCU6480493.1 hypothetical protein [Arthrobacter sp. A2-55]